ncbi:MAG: polysaccharide deacetylase family protein [Candidatus Magasanikbacteria bacterium]|nr:polysaccharide deacetylase family protein [Candidatus Magasanikbacteria bacterium]
MKPNLKNLISAVLYYSGVNRLLGLFLSRSIFLIGYHSISDSANSAELNTEIYPDLTFTTAEFKEQIQFLQKNGHTFTDFQNVSKVIAAGARKPTIIFFDDGFKDNLLNAAPILQKYKIPATFFITAGYINKTHFALTSYYRYLLLEQGNSLAQVEDAIAAFKKLSYQERHRVISELKESLPKAKAWHELNIFLNWEDVRSLRKQGFEIGSHGMSHTKLTECEPEVLKQEATDAKVLIEKELQESIISFSYPHGRYDAKAVQALAETGFTYAVSTVEGVDSVGDLKNIPLTLKKIPPRVNESLIAFAVRLYARAFWGK